MQPGQVRGLRQVVCAYTEECEFLALTFIAALDAGQDGDTVTISGKPDPKVQLKGTNGDIATAAIAVNAVQRVKEAAPGLGAMREAQHHPRYR